MQTQKHLLELFGRLDPGDQASLLAFAEFLAARQPARPSAPPPAARELPAPEQIARPESESIVAGLKRLARTYPMLDKSEMLSATSDIVATHIMRGTDSAQVIDELEEIFAIHYRQLQAAREGSS
ncbi:MAG: Crp/Fnr family transcriptional regulator [Pseudomonadota bacterium]